jgi:hypothetical protein
LESQQGKAQRNPTNWGNWVYWQERTGHEIASQLYKERQYKPALDIYLCLEQLGFPMAKHVPVLYQIGLVYEQMEGPQLAQEYYAKIVALEKEIVGEGIPSLKAILELAKWRHGVLAWQRQTRQPKDTAETGLGRELSANSVR